MNSHDLARLLLEGPDAMVGISAAPGTTNWLQGVADIQEGLIPSNGKMVPVLVLLCTDETINDDEGGSWS